LLAGKSNTVAAVISLHPSRSAINRNAQTDRFYANSLSARAAMAMAKSRLIGGHFPLADLLFDVRQILKHTTCPRASRNMAE
jgi:hypothetical protein